MTIDGDGLLTKVTPFMLATELDTRCSVKNQKQFKIICDKECFFIMDVFATEKVRTFVFFAKSFVKTFQKC